MWLERLYCLHWLGYHVSLSCFASASIFELYWLRWCRAADYCVTIFYVQLTWFSRLLQQLPSPRPEIKLQNKCRHWALLCFFGGPVDLHYVMLSGLWLLSAADTGVDHIVTSSGPAQIGGVCRWVVSGSDPGTWGLVCSNPCCSCRGHGVAIELWKPCLPETPPFPLHSSSHSVPLRAVHTSLVYLVHVLRAVVEQLLH